MDDITTQNNEETREFLRRSLVTEFVGFLSDEASNGNLPEALEDLEKIERYIIGETE